VPDVLLHTMAPVNLTGAKESRVAQQITPGGN